MAKYSKPDSRRMYSWWWDSHISPKNSRWLQENLTDMDFKVKSMIKLIEEDADSFARRAEMYYKKRPELMKLVEEFYRAYRALAERYSHATGVIRHAHLTMAEAFPNQVPSSMFTDDSVSGSDSGTSDPSTPVEKFMDESDAVTGRTAFGRARRNLSFDDTEEITALKEAIAKLEAEKEAGRSQHQQSLDKLSQLNTNMAKTKEEFKLLSDHAAKAESEVIILNKKLSEADAEKESNLQNYHHSVLEISRLHKAESQALKGEIERLSGEKDAALNQYMQMLGTISDLENKLHLAEEDSMIWKERAEKAESELEVLRATVAKLTDEKEAAAEKYQQCLSTISALEEKLNVEITSRDERLKGAEEQFLLLEKSNQSLQMEVEALMLKVGAQSHEFTEKEKEIGRLRSCIQEEIQRFLEAETAFQALQNLHAKTQEELRAMTSELRHKDEVLKNMEGEKKSWEDEVLHLLEVNAIFELTMREMKTEISSLVESKEEETELRKGLQQEINCLKEEINHLNKKHLGVLDQVHASGMELKTENARLRESWEREISEKSALLQKLGILDQLLEKNSVLGALLSSLHSELEAAGRKIEKLEETLQSLLNEKSSVLEEKLTLAVKLEETNRNLEKLSQHNTVLENTLSDAQYQLEALMAKSKILEDSCRLLRHEKTDLKIENDGLTSQLESVMLKLEDLGKLYAEEETRCSALAEEKVSYIGKVEELQLSLDMEIQACQTQISRLETEMGHWQEQCKQRDEELEQMMDGTMANDAEILVLSMMSQELTESNHFLSGENLKFLEDSLVQGRKLLELEKSDLKQQTEIKVLMDQNGELRAEICELQGENSKLHVEKSSLMNEILLLEEKNRVLEEENSVLLDKVLDLENLAMIFRTFSGEINCMMGELNFAQGRLEESEIEKLHLKEQLQMTEEKLQDYLSLQNVLNDEIENGKKQLQQMAMELKLVEEKLIQAEKDKSESYKSLEDLSVLCNKIKMCQDEKENQNQDLRTELAAFAAEVNSLKECIRTLENQTATYIKFQYPENKEFEDTYLANGSEDRILKEDKKETTRSSVLDLCDIRVRLQAAVKAAAEKNDDMVQESADLRSKLDASKKQLQLLQNEVQNCRVLRPKAEITETSDSFLTKDIVLDTVSDSSCRRRGNRVKDGENQMDDLWEISDPDSTVSMSKGVVSSSFREKSGQQTSDSFTEERVDQVQEGKILQRLDSGVQKLVTLQLTVGDMKRKLDAAQKHGRGKAGFECDDLKKQLEEADLAILKLYELNERLMRNLSSSFDKKSFSSFDMDGEEEEEDGGGAKRKKVTQQAHKMSERIGRLQMEVQRIHSVLLKLLDDEKVARTKISMHRRVLLRDYLYGINAGPGRRVEKKAQFCGCFQPSTTKI